MGNVDLGSKTQEDVPPIPIDIARSQSEQHTLRAHNSRYKQNQDEVDRLTAGENTPKPLENVSQARFAINSGASVDDVEGIAELSEVQSQNEEESPTRIKMSDRKTLSNMENENPTLAMHKFSILSSPVTS